MKLQELPAKLKDLIYFLSRKTSLLKPTVKRLAFMLMLFVILAFLVLMYNESFCVNCETGRCECTTQSLLGLGLWADLALAAAGSYLAITIIALLWKT
jgi:hypothetical protein